MVLTSTAVRHVRAVRFRSIASFLLGICVVALAGCVGQVAKTPPPAAPVAAQNARFGHVIVVVEENHNYGDVVANGSAPYLNGLANQYGLATNYFANGHPSIPNYFELTTGKTLTLIDALTPDVFPVSDDNVVRELIAAGKSWKSYAEDLPSIGYTGGDTGKYAVSHNPLVYMTDVQTFPRKNRISLPSRTFPWTCPTVICPNTPLSFPTSVTMDTTARSLPRTIG